MQSTVRVVLDLHFDGEYYSESERLDMAQYWIDGALYDRDDLKDWEWVG